jgi:hypothetical protein
MVVIMTIYLVFISNLTSTFPGTYPNFFSFFLVTAFLTLFSPLFLDLKLALRFFVLSSFLPFCLQPLLSPEGRQTEFYVLNGYLGY